MFTIIWNHLFSRWGTFSFWVNRFWCVNSNLNDLWSLIISSSSSRLYAETFKNGFTWKVRKNVWIDLLSNFVRNKQMFPNICICSSALGYKIKNLTKKTDSIENIVIASLHKFHPENMFRAGLWQFTRNKNMNSCWGQNILKIPCLYFTYNV